MVARGGAKKVGLAGIAFLAALQLHAASQYVLEPQIEACRLWEKLEHDVRDGNLPRREARSRFKKLWAVLQDTRPPEARKGRWQWVFPLPGGDKHCFSSKSYRGAGYSYYDGPRRQGHPAIDLFVHDRDKDARDDRNHKRIPVVAAMDGVVVSTQPAWDPQDANPDGVYVCILDQEDGRLFTYARLDRLKVSLGQKVARGQVVGWAGRTGKDVFQTSMRTHVHFQVQDFSDGLFYTLNPARALRLAKRLPWPLREPSYGEAKSAKSPGDSKEPKR